MITQFVRGGRLPDIGTGIGQFLFHVRESFSVFGTEVSREAIRIAEERYDIDLTECRIE